MFEGCLGAALTLQRNVSDATVRSHRRSSSRAALVATGLGRRRVMQQDPHGTETAPETRSGDGVRWAAFSRLSA